MPISKINPDGSVKIFSKTTGKTLDVQPGDLANYNPAMVGEYQTMLQAQQQGIQQAAQAVSSGGLKPADLPADQRAAVVNAVQSSGKTIPAPKPNAPAITAQQMGLAKAGIQNIQHVKDMYAKDPNLLTKQLMPGQFMSREFDSALYDTADALLRLRTGAQANPGEIRGYMQKIAPSFGDDPKTVQYKLQKLENDFNIASGKDANAQPIDISKIQQKETGNPLTDAMKGNPITNFLLGAATNVAQDIGTGIRAIAGKNDLSDKEQLAKAYEDKAAQTQDPRMKKDLLQSANQVRGQISGEAQDVSHSFSEDVQKNPISRAVTAANQIASTAELGGNLLGKAIPNKGNPLTTMRGSGGKDIIDAVTSPIGKVLHPFKAVGDYRNAAAQAADQAGVKVSGNKLIDALEGVKAKVPSTEIDEFNNMLEGAKSAYQNKSISVGDSLGLNTHLNDAYTASGRVGKTAKALVEDTLGKALRIELKSQAPEVAHANKLFTYLYGAQKLGTRVGIPAAAGGVGTGIGVYALDKVLNKH